MKWWECFLCCVIGWHNGNLPTARKGRYARFDGCSVHRRCSRCKREVMQDSQGNWF